MSCIVGLVGEGIIFMGADSAGLHGWDLTIRADEKVFQHGPFLIGFSGSFRLGQLLRYRFVPHDPSEADSMRYLVTTFVDAVRDCFKDGNDAGRKKDRTQRATFS